MFFKKSHHKEIDILPPPPPFPKLEPEAEELLKGKIPELPEIKPKKEKKRKTKMEVELKDLETQLFTNIKEEEKLKTKGRLFKFRKRLHEKKTKTKAEKQPVIKGGILPEAEIPKPHEISRAEEEIKKAIADLKKKSKKPVFGLFSQKKQKPEKEAQLPKMPEPEELPSLEINEKKKPMSGIFKQKKKKPRKQEAQLPEIPKSEIPKPEVLQEEPEETPPLQIKEPADKVAVIKHKMHDARTALMEFELDKAKRAYIEIMQIYNDLVPEQQAKVYEQINDLYSERKNAESLKLKA